jgi:nitrite reductase/ring-hydroxylating ferredoxin subunit
MADRLWACRSDALRDGAHLKLDVIFSGKPASLILFRYEGQCFCYLNLCVHMARPLDCEEDIIFDPTGRHLRCSMHGIVFDPATGESLSTICAGQRLTAVKFLEDEEAIWIKDRRVSAEPSSDEG